MIIIIIFIIYFDDYAIKHTDNISMYSIVFRLFRFLLYFSIDRKESRGSKIVNTNQFNGDCNQTTHQNG